MSLSRLILSKLNRDKLSWACFGAAAMLALSYGVGWLKGTTREGTWIRLVLLLVLAIVLGAVWYWRQ